jgi:hypothetical protein
MSPFVLPDATQLRRHLEMLLGDGVAVHPAPDMSADSPFCGVYRNDEDQPVAVCLANAGFAAYAGAALSMMLPADAQAAARNGELPDTMKANLYEIMNIMSGLLMTDRTPHLRMREMSTATTADPVAKAIAAQPSRLVTYDVEIPRYGTGRIAFALK